MKNFLTKLILLVLVTLPLGCSQTTVVSSHLKSEYFSLGESVFSYDYSTTIFEFGQIVKAASVATSDSDFAYLNGRIDGYLGRGPLIYSEIGQMDKTYLDKFITPELQSPILNLPNELSTYLKNLQSEVIKKKDLNKLGKMKNDLKTLYELERDINNDMFRNKEGAKQYKDLIQRMQQIMKTTY